MPGQSTSQSTPRGNIPPGIGGFTRTVRREYSDLRDFYLDDERRKQLDRMNAVKRFFVTTWWLLKSLYFKLTPVRRVILVIGIAIALTSGSFRFDNNNITITNDTSILGFTLLLFVLMLELKDKLLAHDELKAGHAVQEALMPDRVPAIPGWDVWMITRSANDVGGDLLDYFPLGRGRYNIALGDIAGKGLPAALFMAKLQATLRALRSYSVSLSDFVGKVNEVFYRDKLPTTFASLVYLEFESSSPAIRVINAGHFLPMRLTAGRVEEVPKSGPGIGIVPKVEFTEQQVEMQNGDLLLIYSDGLSEARNQMGEFFGEQRIAGLLPSLRGYSSTKAGERILTSVYNFLNGTPLQDDLTLIILQRQTV